ncbi:hypothetical protein F5Y18DRAFT_181356 [Xylariaceae sp. FL1019]|nr:hypothetical protein F5Y18DRAFT_181356 [Xylariaceae sp. FL1019]
MTPTALIFAIMASLMASLTLQSPIKTRSLLNATYPTRVLGNVMVVDTSIVQQAQGYARKYSSSAEVYNHVIRGWLFGVLMLQHNQTLSQRVDPEVHAVAAILHDLGWDQTPDSPVVSRDRRFEVDSAIGAREFLWSRDPQHKDWGEYRTQLVWDSIALHTQESIYLYKEAVVSVTGSGILSDFDGPLLGVTQAEYDAVAKEFPKGQFVGTVNQTFVWLCQTKQSSTYDTFMQPWGEKFVEGYNASGHRIFDDITGT